ncbi:MAG: isoprenylcysteine carboxylmethyltransferase family protein [Gammaproteobacteria bacterium]
MRPRIPPPIIGIAFGVAMWLIARKVGVLGFPGQPLVAAVLMLCGGVIDLLSVAAFFSARTTVNPLRPERAESLVVTGFFRYSRNPMYLGMLLILTGWAVWLGQPLNLLLLVWFVLSINTLQIRPEELALEAKFGDDYRAYCARVRRWI